MKTAEEILIKIFEPESHDCSTIKQDLQLVITLNPDLNKIYKAMEEYASQFYLKEFVEWAINHREIYLKYGSLDELYEYWKTNIKDK